MKSAGLYALAVLATTLCAVAARAETEAEYATAPVGSAVPAPAPARPSRPAAFAPDAAKTAARLPVELREERAFLRTAAANARFETQASKLVLGKSKDLRVRAFAADLVARDKATGAELTYLLHVRGMALPMMEPGHTKLLKALGKLGGTKFDRTYMEEVGLKSHREDIRQYEKISAATKDPSLKTWVDRELVTLRNHLVLAEHVMPHEGRAAQAMGAAPAPQPVSARVSGSGTR